MPSVQAIRSRLWVFLAVGVGVWLIAAMRSGTSAAKMPVGSPERMVAGALDGMTRASLAGALNTSPSVQLYAARGEYEPFQVAVDVQNGSVEPLSIAVSDLQSPGGVIERSNLPVYREHFVHVKQGSPDFGGTNRPSGPGMYPDALIPESTAARAERFSGAPEREAPGARVVFWIDVFVPRQAQPGSYCGTVTVSSSTEKATIPVSLVVWRHTLPLRPSLKSSFGIDRKRIRDERILELLLAHRLMPFLVDPARSTYYRDKFGMNATGLWFFGDVNYRTCTMNPAPAVDAVRAAVARYPADVEKYVYAADEIDRCASMFPAIKQWARNVHEAGAKMLVTVTPTQALLDDNSGTARSAVDFWVLLPKMHVAALLLVQEVLRKGDEVWSYNAMVQDSYSPKWEIDFDPINYRIQPGFLSQSLGLTGLLYSVVDRWNVDPWSNTNSFETEGYTFPGEDMLVYPGEPAGSIGPLPSMRLKWLRKGVEDYEYVEMLKRAGRSDFALSVIHSVVPDWSSWTRSSAALETARRKLGEELDRVERVKDSTSVEKGPAALQRTGPAISLTVENAR